MTNINHHYQFTNGLLNYYNDIMWEDSYRYPIYSNQSRDNNEEDKKSMYVPNNIQNGHTDEFTNDSNSYDEICYD